MIDASRLSHSLATALKDRPHGIPSQPNRSLPLRPPPPLPIRNSLVKSPKNSTVTPATGGTRQATQNGGKCAASINKDNTKERNLKSDGVPSLGVVGMNFYDSKDEEDNSNDKCIENIPKKMPKDLVKSRHTKSLDNDETNEISCGAKRRNSFGYESIPRDGDGKREDIDNFEWDESTGARIVHKEKKRRGSYAKKRKSSSAEDNPDGFRKEKSPRIENIDALNTSGKSKTISQNEAEDPVSQSKNFDIVESSDMILPTIFKYRNAESASPLSADKRLSNDAQDCSIVDMPNWKQTGSNTYKFILPKPANIPKCPVAIPIELAHAMNQGDPRNSNNNAWKNEKDIAKSQMGNVAQATNRSDSMKPKINAEKTRKTDIPESMEDTENTLPSMPSLEDMMQTNAGLRYKLSLSKSQADSGDADSDVARELRPMGDARVLQAPGDPISETGKLDANDTIQGNINSVHDRNLNKSHESIVNLTTVLEIKIPGRSPELIILKAPQIMSNGKGDSIANNSLVEATTPVSLSSGIQPALEEPRKITETKEVDTLSRLREYENEQLREYRTSEEKILLEQGRAEISFPVEFPLVNDRRQQGEDLLGNDQPRYTLQHKSPVEFEVRIKDTSASPQTQEPVQRNQEDESIGEKQREDAKDSQARYTVEDIVRCRKNRYNLKLRKLYEEEAHLKCKMSQTSDPSRLTRLQQKINCAEKKIENIQKYLNKLPSIENPGSCASPAQLRIQVRQDLVQKISSPESVEPDSQSPLRPTNEIDKASIGKSQPVLPPIVITILESDSASSGEELDTPNGKSPDNVKSHLQTDAEMKFNDNNTPENDTKVAYTVGDSLTGDKVDNALLNMSPVMTNNNVEYLNKNLPPVYKSVPESVNINSLSIPRVPASANTDLLSIPPLIPDPINYSLRNLNSIAGQKSPTTQHGSLNLNLPLEKVDKERSKPKCDCLTCLRSNSVAVTTNTPKYDRNNFIPNAVSDLRTPITIRRTAIQENTNVRPGPDYPVQRTDYGTMGSASSMFSRDNGGANINLSSPLQGHSALPLPPPYYRNLTAQGYPIPTESSPNHQTMQWHNQHPPTKSSVPFTPDQDGSSHSSILAAHLSKSQAQEPANYPSSIKLSSLAQSKEAATRTDPATHINKHIMTAQFPTLGNWAAQMTRESTIRKPVNISNSDGTGYKTTGSDMYKMAATAIEPTHRLTAGNPIHWPSGKPHPEQPRPIQAFPGHRSIPHSYRRDYPPSPQNPQNSHNVPAKYPGSEVYVPYLTNPYHQVPSGPQSTQSTQHSNSQLSHDQHNAQKQYQPPTSSTRSLAPGTYQKQGNSPHLVNSIGMVPQQYLQQPPSYLQAMLPRWHPANNYHQNYMGSQYNGFNVQSNPVNNDATAFRPTHKTLAPMQPNHSVIARNLMHNVANVKLPSPVYNLPANLNTVVQDGRNVEPLDLGRSFVAPHLDKVHKSSDRSSTLKCSRCGTPGPRFNCFGCETAFYCNEQCQAQHWSTHFIECPKKMPKLKKVS